MGNNDLEKMLGDPKRAIRSMSLPIFISLFVIQFNSVFDVMIGSTVSADVSAAIGAISPLYWIIEGVGTGVGVGASTAIAKRLGKKDAAEAEVVISQTAVFGIVLSLVLIPVLYLVADPVIGVMGASDYGGLCMSYITPIVILSPFIVMNGILSGFLRGEGAAKRTMAMGIVTASVNMVLNPILVIGLDMGASGSGLATALASVASTLMGLSWYLRERTYLRLRIRGYSYRRGELAEVLDIGSPKAAERTVLNSMAILQRSYIMQAPTRGMMTIYTIAWRFVDLTAVPSRAISYAVNPILAAAMAQRDFKKANTAAAYAMNLNLAVSLGITAFLLLFADWLVIPFMGSDTMAELKDDIVLGVRICALVVPLYGVSAIGAALLQTIHHAHMSLVISLFREALILALLVVNHGDLVNVFFSIFVGEVIGSLLMIAVARRMYHLHIEEMRKDIDGEAVR